MTCRRNEAGYLYRAYPVIPPILYVVFSFSLACNISWLLIWDREYMEVSPELSIHPHVMNCLQHRVLKLTNKYALGILN